MFVTTDEGAIDLAASVEQLPPEARTRVQRGLAGSAQAEAAIASLGGLGAVDVTFARLGDRIGFVVTVPQDGTIEIVVRSPEIGGECRYRYDGLEVFDSPTTHRPAELGISEGGAIGLTVEGGLLRPRGAPCSAPTPARTAPGSEA